MKYAYAFPSASYKLRKAVVLLLIHFGTFVIAALQEGRNTYAGTTGLACIRATENCGHSEDPREGSGDLQILLPSRHPRSTMKARNFGKATYSIYSISFKDTYVIEWLSTVFVSIFSKFLVSKASDFCIPLPPRTQQNLPQRPLSPAKDRY